MRAATATTSPTPEPGIRAQILASATRLFAAHGFEGTSLQRIAEAVGIRKPSLLHHFPSKEELRRHVFESMLAHWNDALPRLLLAATGGARFESIMHELVTFFLADPDRARLLVRETLDRPTEVQGMLVARVRPWVEAIAGYIRKGQRHGESHPGADPESYVVHILRLVIVGVATSETFGVLLTPGTEGPVPRQVRELMRIAKDSLFLKERLPRKKKQGASRAQLLPR